jgi:ribose/xylose/arabinose/galactoside ABC-type transport system permease subunit
VLPFLPIPNAVMIMFIVAVLSAIVLNKTALGRYTFALGSNEEAVRLSGVNVDRWKVIIYAFSGGICGIAGILIASRLNSAQPALGQGYELDAISLGSLLGDLMPMLPIPNAVMIMFIVAVFSAVILNKTALGRYTFALGSNEEAVRLSGVNVDRWKVIIYAFSGGICGIAGILIASRLNSAQPALGQGYELDAIAAVVIGGTSLSGGVGTILGTIIGAFIMSVLINGLRIMSVAQEWQMVLTGLIIILAVYTDNLRRKKQ